LVLYSTTANRRRRVGNQRRSTLACLLPASSRVKEDDPNPWHTYKARKKNRRVAVWDPVRVYRPAQPTSKIRFVIKRDSNMVMGRGPCSDQLKHFETHVRIHICTQSTLDKPNGAWCSLSHAIQIEIATVLPMFVPAPSKSCSASAQSIVRNFSISVVLSLVFQKWMQIGAQSHLHL
jgi:hypothetical protein